MPVNETPLVFECQGQRLIGIVHHAQGAVGLLVIVGGPQYRAGSHRQFLLLARHLAANGVPVMRFDYRGMGDSEGEQRSFDDIEADIRAAIDAFYATAPGLSSVVLWGLCDAASAATFYAGSDPRVTGMVLLNPWVTTEAGAAKAYLRHYYLQRLGDGEFWRKLFSGRFELRNSCRALLEKIHKSRGAPGGADTPAEDGRESQSNVPLPQRMYEGLRDFHGWVRVIISGNDLTAAEFQDMVKGSSAWQRLLKRRGAEFHYLPAANHTFSRQSWRDEVAEQTLRWIKGQS